MEKHSEIYISVDIEASGPIPGEYSMLSLGACVVSDTTRTFYSELKPLNDNFIDKALEVSGFSLDELKNKGAEPATAMAKFDAWIKQVAGDNRPVFLAFNATFDWSFTHWYFIKFLNRDPFGISGLDIKAYFMGKHNLNWNDTTKKGSRQFYQLNKPHTHNALDDAIEQAELFSLMLNS